MAAAAAALFLLLLGWVRCGPLPKGFLDEGPHTSVRVTDRAGGSFMNRSPSARRVALGWGFRPAARPIQATLAAEDRRFFRHPAWIPSLWLVRRGLI